MEPMIANDISKNGYVHTKYKRSRPALSDTPFISVTGVDVHEWIWPGFLSEK